MVLVKRFMSGLGPSLVVLGLAAACAPGDNTASDVQAYGGKGTAMTFDPNVWSDENAWYEAPYPRRQMVDDVRARLLVPSMSRADVIAVLGSPTDTPYFADHDLVYWIGPEEGFSAVDSQWFVFHFNDRGKFESSEIMTD